MRPAWQSLVDNEKNRHKSAQTLKVVFRNVYLSLRTQEVL